MMIMLTLVFSLVFINYRSGGFHDRGTEGNFAVKYAEHKIRLCFV